MIIHSLLTLKLRSHLSFFFLFLLFLEGFGLLRRKLETLQGVFDFVHENKYKLLKDCERNPQFWKDIMM